MIKKKIFILVINKKVIDVFLRDHVINLSNHYEIEFISSTHGPTISINKKPYKNYFVNLKRSFSLTNLSRNIFEILIIILKKKPSLVISLHPKNGLLVSICKLFFNFKNLHIITGQIWANNKNLYKLLFKSIDKFIIFKSNFLLIDSKSQISYLKKEGFNVGKITCINNGSICGINQNKYYKSNLNRINFFEENNLNIKTKLILFSGRINISKGILILLNAFKLLINDNYNCHLLVIGDDEINFSSIIKKQDLKYRNKITILSYTENINYYYSLSNIFCLPSFREGFGMSVIEASSSYLPVIVSDIYGLYDSSVDNLTGLKFKCGDHFDLKKKLSMILDNPKNSEAYGRNGKLFVEKYFQKKEILNFMNNFIKKII